MLLLAGSAGLSKRVNFAASLLPQEPRSLANAHAMAANWTCLTRLALQLSVWRGFEARKGVMRHDTILPWWRSHCDIFPCPMPS